MNYATGCAFNLDELMMNFNMKKLDLTSKKAKELYGNAHRDLIVKRVFREALKIILNDIIDNNVTFDLPTGGRPSSIYVKRTCGDDFMTARKNGKWLDVDFLESNFSGNLLTLRIKNKFITKEKPIYVDPKLKNKLTENTNKGKQYC